MSRLFDVANVIDSDDWYTPAWIFDGLGVTFDIDVAAPDGGAANVPALDHFTVADDGLLQPWFGVVWCNPILVELTDENGDTYRVPAGHIAFISDGDNMALIVSVDRIA